MRTISVSTIGPELTLYFIKATTWITLYDCRLFQGVFKRNSLCVPNRNFRCFFKVNYLWRLAEVKHHRNYAKESFCLCGLEIPIFLNYNL